MTKKIVISVYSKPTYSHRYIDGTLYHLIKSINGISIGVVNWLKQMCSNDNDFSEQPKSIMYMCIYIYIYIYIYIKIDI